MKIGTPIDADVLANTQAANKSKGGLILPVCAVFLAGGALLAFKLDRNRNKTAAGNEEEQVQSKSKREVADEEKRKLTPAEMGRKGGKARAEALRKKKAAAEEGGDNDDTPIQA